MSPLHRCGFRKMSFRSLFFLLACWCTLTGEGYAQQTGLSISPAADSAFRESEEKVEAFFLNLAASPSKAFEDLLKGGPLAGSGATGSTDSLRMKLSTVANQFGRYHGHERIDAKLIGSDLILMRYLYKCDKFPIVWYFTFYRTPTSVATASTSGGSAWMVIGIRFDTNLEVLAL